MPKNNDKKTLLYTKKKKRPNKWIQRHLLPQLFLQKLGFQKQKRDWLLYQIDIKNIVILTLICLRNTLGS